MNIALSALGILLVSILGGVILSRRKSVNNEDQNKIILFVLYFWLFAFFQLIIFAIGYSLIRG